MSFYKVTIQAGVKTGFRYSGLFFALDDAGAARQVDVQLSYQGNDDTVMPSRVAGFQCPAQFDQIYLTAVVTTTVQFFATNMPVQLGIKDGAVVQVPNGVAVTNSAAQAIPVSIATPVTLNATAVQVNNTTAQAIPVNIQNTNPNPILVQRQTLTNIVDIAAATVGTEVAPLISNATLLRLKIKSSTANTGNIYIGGAGVTAANAAIVLQPGDMWNEEDLAGAAWYAVADNAGSIVTMQGAK